MRKKVYLFDFDGTITSRDTLLCFIRYACGTWKFLLGFALFSPLLVLMKLRLYPNYRAKQKVFSWFFRGIRLVDFNRLCANFAADNRHLLRPKAIDLLKRVFADGDDVLVVSASIDNWVLPFIEEFSCDSLSYFSVVGTKVEVVDGRLTGRFLTYNCYGAEKVRRIRRIYPNREDFWFIALGDSRGDREMLAFADEHYYKPFRE